MGFEIIRETLRTMFTYMPELRTCAFVTILSIIGSYIVIMLTGAVISNLRDEKSSLR